MSFKLTLRNLLIAAAAALILIYIAPLGSYPLIEPDEGRYAEIPREMISSGNYITPMLNYVKYFEKPAFLYWMNAAAMRIFGENEFAARIGSALCALGGAAAAGALGAFVYGPAAGLISGIVTATMLLYFAVGTLNITDMPLSFFITLALVSFYIANAGGKKRFYLLFYFSCALAVLTKGLIGIVLPGAVIFFYMLTAEQRKHFFSPLYLPGIILFFAVSVPWFYLVCKSNPDFFRFFFIQEHFMRYLTNMHGRYMPFWFFFAIIPAAAMPWTAFLFALCSRESVLRDPRGAEESSAAKFLLIWFAVILLFFSFSHSKLIPYIVPCIPPAAILAGADISRMAEDERWHGFAPHLLAALNCLLAAMLFFYANTGKDVTPAEALPAAARIGAALAAMPLAVFCFTGGERRRFKEAAAALCLCAVLFVWGLQSVYGIIAPQRSMKEVSEIIVRESDGRETIAAFDELLHGIPFYTKRRVLTVGSPGELEYGSGQPEGRGWFLSRKEFLRQWYGGKKSFILVAKNDGTLKSLFPNGVSRAAKRFDAGDYVVLFSGRRRGGK
ncbi:MAG: glycosyltransferase family 39 protein [Synergistes sp.]|nr:glycosyltransferase family 39 protein [Synergistes sp.]